MDITLKTVEDADIHQLSLWLHKNYVRKYYNPIEDWLHEIRERQGAFSFLHHFIVYAGSVPMGFCQYYDCFDAQEDWYTVTKQAKLYSIDYFIGEEGYLRQGYGKLIVKMLIQKIKALPEAKEIVVQPEEENIASCKALLANGFVYDSATAFYRLALKDISREKRL